MLWVQSLHASWWYFSSRIFVGGNIIITSLNLLNGLLEVELVYTTNMELKLVPWIFKIYVFHFGSFDPFMEELVVHSF